MRAAPILAVAAAAVLFLAPLAHFGELSTWHLDRPMRNVEWDEAGTQAEPLVGPPLGPVLAGRLLAGLAVAAVVVGVRVLAAGPHGIRGHGGWGLVVVAATLAGTAAGGVAALAALPWRSARTTP